MENLTDEELLDLYNKIENFINLLESKKESVGNNEWDNWKRN